MAVKLKWVYEVEWIIVVSLHVKFLLFGVLVVTNLINLRWVGLQLRWKSPKRAPQTYKQG